MGDIDSGSQLKKGVILNYINLALSSLVPLLYTPVMLSLLGQNEYGLYKLSGSITSYLSLISLGLGAAITRYLIKFRIESGKEAEEKILGLFVAIFRTIALITVIVGSVLALNVGTWFSASLSIDDLSTMKVLVLVLACNTAVNFLSAPYISVVNSHERFVFLQSLNIFATCIAPILNLVALFMGYASIGLAVSSLVATLLFQIIYVFYVKNKMQIKAKFSRPPKELLKEILSFSFWIFISSVVLQLYGATNTIMIGYMPALATVGVAIYTVGEIFNSIIGTLNSGISSLLIPKANKMVFGNASSEELTDTTIRMGRIQCLIIALFIFGFIAFGQPFIHFYAGDEYVLSYWIAVICMVPNFVPLVQSFCLNIIIAKNKNRFRAFVYLFVAILNVFGSYFLLQLYGVMGAAIMLSFSSILGNGIIMNWYYKKKMCINIFKFWKEICKLLVFPIGLCLGVFLMYNFLNFYDVKILIGGIIGFTILYIIGCWFLEMNEDEKQLIKNIFKV